MRARIAWTSIVACAFVVSIAATQDKPAPPQGGGQKEHTMTGCLQKGPTATTFVVQNTAGEKPKMIGIIESKVDLVKHLGHKIDITGTAVPNKEAAGMKDVPTADHYMRITAMKMVAATCP
jgi:hypothetical protein